LARLQQASLQSLPATTTVEETIVWGRKQQHKGSAFSASEGLVGYDDFKVRPIQRIGELAQVLPPPSTRRTARRWFKHGGVLSFDARWDRGNDYPVDRLVAMSYQTPRLLLPGKK
jgi:hypothetical protein